MKKYSKSPVKVWEDKRGLVRCLFDEDTANIWLEVGNGFGGNISDDLFYCKININGFWKSLAEFMRTKEAKINGEVEHDVLAEERLALTNQLIKIQGWNETDETKEAMNVVLGRLKVLDSLILPQITHQEIKDHKIL